MLQFLVQVFPCAKFVLSYRKDVSAQMNSSFLAKHGNISDIEEKTNVLQKFYEMNKTRSFLIALEDFNDFKVWNSLFSFLDRPLCRVLGVLHYHPHSSVSQDRKNVVYCKPKFLMTPSWISKNSNVLSPLQHWLKVPKNIFLAVCANKEVLHESWISNETELKDKTE